MSNADEAAFKGSFQQHHDLILQLIGISDGPALFPPIVEVENGRVRGNLERLHRVVQWFGIPYAAPASGENRWKKPQPAPRIRRVLNCTKPGERNLQCLHGKLLGAEGRLTLNICRRNSPDRGLPVMVYLHGGNFQTGQAEEWLGNKFSEALNVVHVSIAYRLGALGCSPKPGRTGKRRGNGFTVCPAPASSASSLPRGGAWSCSRSSSGTGPWCRRRPSTIPI